MALILDTGPLYAALDRDDADHEASRRLILGAGETLVIPAPVLVEVDYWVSTRLGGPIFAGLLEDILDGAFAIEDPVAADYHRIREICRQYSDTPVGFVDASVLAIVERLNEPKLATLDRRHFTLLRPRHVVALELLP